MYRQIPVANRICAEKWKERDRKLHKKRLRDMKSEVDNAPPPLYIHLVQNLKKAQIEEDRYVQIERQNRLLLEKMAHIMHKRSSYVVEEPKYRRSLNAEHRRRELIRISSENQQILNRIRTSKPYYNTSNWEADWAKQQHILRNICQYPPVIGVDDLDEEGAASLMSNDDFRRQLEEGEGELDSLDDITEETSRLNTADESYDPDARPKKGGKIAASTTSRHHKLGIRVLEARKIEPIRGVAHVSVAITHGGTTMETAPVEYDRSPIFDEVLVWSMNDRHTAPTQLIMKVRYHLKDGRVEEGDPTHLTLKSLGLQPGITADKWIYLDDSDDNSAKLHLKITFKESQRALKVARPKQQVNPRQTSPVKKSGPRVPGTLKIRLVDATGLDIDEDAGDICCVAVLLDQEVMTQTATDPGNPTWEEDFDLHVVDAKKQAVTLFLVDKATQPASKLGKASLALASLDPNGEESTHSLPLSTTGEINVKVTLNVDPQ
eukprot:GFYU01004093.1.p1 GENE.GFYU01004093.1~~GFYU01004093.1.p1  ORF type:complete len:491 (-),score=140.47 GFYU01004093.1:155-1627(-)